MKGKKILPLIALVAMSLVACTGPKPTPSEDKSEPVSEQPVSSNTPSSSSTSVHTHKYGDWTVTKEATCLEEGSRERVCSCGEKQTEVVAKKAHEFEASALAYPQKSGDVATSLFTCKTCKGAALQWSALDMDEALSLEACGLEKKDTTIYSEINTSGSHEGSIRLRKAENDGGTEAKGTHAIYKVFVDSEASNVDLEFEIDPKSGYDVPVFDYVDGDAQQGYRKIGEELKLTTKRYGLKVNGVDVELGDDLHGAVNGGSHLWFNWNVKMNLKAGENIIDVYCLGGYRAYIYNFRLTGLPEYHEHVHEWNEGVDVAADEALGTVAYKKFTCKGANCNAVKIEVALSDSMLDEGSKNKNDPAGYMKLKSNGNSFSFKFNYDAVAKGKLYQRGVMDGWDANKGKFMFSSGKENGADDFELKLNGEKVDVSAYKNKTFEQVMTGEPQEGGLSALTDVESGVIALKEGVNEINYKRVGSYNIAMTHMVFIVENHVHEWGPAQDVAADATLGTVAYKKFACTDPDCKLTKIEVALDDSMLASGSANKNDPAGYMKLKSNGQSFGFKFAYNDSAKGKLFQRGVMDGWTANKGKNVFSSGKAGGADDFELKVNGEKVDVSAYKGFTFEQIMTGEPQEGNLSALTDVESGVVVLKDGVNEVNYKRVASYNIAMTHMVFIVGHYDAPIPEVAQPVGDFHGMAKKADGSFIPVDLKLAADSAVLNINGETAGVTAYKWDGKECKLELTAAAAYGTITAVYDAEKNVFGSFALTGAAAATLDATYAVALSGNCQFLACEEDTATLQNIFLRRKMGSSWEPANADDKIFSAESGKDGKGLSVKCWADGKIALTLKSDLQGIKAGDVKSVGCWIYNPSTKDYKTTLYFYKGAGNTNNQQAKVFTLPAGQWTFCQCGVAGLLADTDTFYNFQFYTENVNTTLVFDNFCLYM